MIVSLFGDTYCTNADCIDPRCDAIRGGIPDAAYLPTKWWARSHGSDVPTPTRSLRNCEKRRIVQMFDYMREHENDFSFWYPKIKDCGIPTPLTFYTKLPSAEKEPEYAKRLY